MLSRILVAFVCLIVSVAPAMAATLIAPGEDHVSLAGKFEYLEDPTRQLTIADIAGPALYEAKRTGRNRVIMRGSSSAPAWGKND